MHYRPITRFTTTAFAGIIVLVALSAFIGSAAAVPPGKTVEYDRGTIMGTVTFDGAVHADRGYECFHCHTLLFKFRKGQRGYRMKLMMGIPPAFRATMVPMPSRPGKL